MIIGIDIGTQSLKAVLLGDDMTVRGEASVSYEPDFPQPGWAEQDPVVWEAALKPAIMQVLEKGAAAAGDIAALGIGGQLDGCIAVNSEGTPVHPCLIWMDRRAEPEIEGMSPKDVLDASGVILDASHMAAKIRWLKNNVPAAQGALFHQPVSYIVQRLTDQAVMDHGLASTSMLYALGPRAFDPWLMEMFDIERSELPALAKASDRAGTLTQEGARLTGLLEGTPVSVGTGDDFSTPLGAGIVQPGRLVCVLGTAEVVGAVHPQPVIDKGGLVETHAYAGNSYFIENPGWLSGGALAWFKDTFRLTDFAELDSLGDAVSPGAEGVTFLPGLSGTMAPEWVASARGAFYGLTPAHGTGHLARAVLEGTAYAMRDVVERLGELEVAVEAIRVLGGGAKSRVWAQIRADMTGLPVEIPDVTDTAPIGSGLLAAVAVGIEPDIAKAAEMVGGIADIVGPNSDTKPAYDEAYGTYRNLFDALRPMF